MMATDVPKVIGVSSRLPMNLVGKDPSGSETPTNPQTSMIRRLHFHSHPGGHIHAYTMNVVFHIYQDAGECINLCTTDCVIPCFFNSLETTARNRISHQHDLAVPDELF